MSDERTCEFHDEEYCPPDCKGKWPTCSICGKTLDFWNGDEFDEANVYIITESGMNCDEDEEIDLCYHLCPACYEKVKAFIEGLKTRPAPMSEVDEVRQGFDAAGCDVVVHEHDDGTVMHVKRRDMMHAGISGVPDRDDEEAE
jgi:hypothetical protein